MRLLCSLLICLNFFRMHYIIGQREYVLFPGSTKRWNVLLEHVPRFNRKIIEQYSLGESHQKCLSN
jgi:hypothetical protein